MEHATAIRLAGNVRQRRADFGMGINDAARASRGLVSATSWRRVEDPERLSGSKLRRRTLLGVADALALERYQVFEWAGLDYNWVPSDPPVPHQDVDAKPDVEYSTGSDEIPGDVAVLWQALGDEQRRVWLRIGEVLREASG